MCFAMGQQAAPTPRAPPVAPTQTAASRDAVEERKRARQLAGTQSFNPQLLEGTLTSGGTTGSLLS